MASDLTPPGDTPFTPVTTPTLYCWGCGEFGQHGHGHKADISFQESEVMQFGSTTALGTVCHISCGASHTVVVTESGDVYTWGNGNSGQLGSGDQEIHWAPTPVSINPPAPQGSKVRTVACGSRHTLVVMDNGNLHSFGNNFYAQLGYNFRENNYKENQVTPHFLEFLKHRAVRQVACGDKHSLILFMDGSLAAVGNNAHGQLGDGGVEESAVPRPVDVEGAVRTVSCGPHHSLALTEKGHVYAWGYGKACGKRRRDVTTPELMAFKGREVVQVAGGSTHNLALTAGGKVYSWGFGTDGQLGLGSVVMATRPRRVQHSFLEEGASFVACGDAFSAVLTVWGRLYMWGRNSHTIEKGKGTLHRVWDPVCVNPPPSPPLRHLACGAWHVAALSGLPDFVPVPEEGAVSSEDDSGSSHSDNSRLSSAGSAESVERSRHTKGPPLETNGGRVEVSAAPHTTTNPFARGPTLTKPAPFLVARGNTKLTIGEFYATSSESASSSDRSSKRSSKPPVTFPQPPPPSPPKPQSAPTSSSAPPLVIEVPFVTLDPESDLEEPLPVCTGEEVGTEGQPGDCQEPKEENAQPPLFLPAESASSKGSKGEEEEDRTNSRSDTEWPAVALTVDLKSMETKSQGKGMSGESTGTGEREQTGRIGWEEKQGKVGGTAPSTEALSPGPRSRTTFNTQPHPMTQGNRGPPKSSVVREKSVVVSRNMNFLDASQLLTGTPGPSKTGAPTSIFTPGQPIGEKGGGRLGFFQDIFACFPPGLEHLGDFDLDYLEASPRTSKHTAMHHVPTVQLGADFGPRHVKRSATFFGALTGQVTRSPTKFFRKPSGHSLARTPTPTTHSTHPPYTPLTRTRTHVGEERGEGRRGAGGPKGVDSSGRPFTRGLGALTGGKSHGLDRSESQKAPPSTILPLSKLDLQDQDPSRIPSRTPFFSSAASWRQRPPDPHSHPFHDSQSAPSSSTVGRMKHVAFAEDGRKTSGGTTIPYPTRPSAAGTSPAGRSHVASVLGSSLPAANPRPACQSDMVAENAGVPLLQEGSSSAASLHGSPSGKSHTRLAVEQSRGKNENTAPKFSKNARQLPTLTYKSSNKRDVDSSLSPQEISPRPGVLQSSVGNTRSTYLASDMSRTKTVVSGAGERNRMQFN
ncbi:uncharacterized protein LOC143297438 isoform X2 [Babylonia areolata]|uniref:uncharacterized protein LOC143297438 isoform X2 n=1 Tax=Babylonia areolata TaxID=304850 RepID=UPI003FD1C68B